MIRFLERAITDAMHAKLIGWRACIAAFFLFPISLLYGAVSKLKNFAFDAGVLKAFHADAFVVSVGNLVIGGTGKTPLTCFLADLLCRETSLAILSRGYRSQAETFKEPIFLSHGDGPIHSVDVGGDEAHMLARKLSGVSVLVGADRVKSAQIAAKSGHDLLLLDDGFQHRRLARDLDIVVIDSQFPLGYTGYIPHGLLRESLKSLSRASLIFVSRLGSKEKFQEIERQVRLYTSAPIVGAESVAGPVVFSEGEQLKSLQRKKIGIFCGIARPELFRQTLLDLGAEILQECFFPDHANFPLSELESFSQVCKKSGADLLICTEKDQGKFHEQDLELPVAALSLDIKLSYGLKDWNFFLNRLREKLREK